MHRYAQCTGFGMQGRVGLVAGVGVVAGFEQWAWGV